MTGVIVSPRFEWLQAVAALATGEAGQGETGQAETVAPWLERTRRRLDRPLLRQLATIAARDEFWRLLAAIAVDVDPDTDTVSGAFDVLLSAEALSPSEYAALRKFDRLAFAALWRQLLPDFEAAADRFHAPQIAGSKPARGNDVLLVPTAFAPRIIRCGSTEVRLLLFERAMHAAVPSISAPAPEQRTLPALPPAMHESEFDPAQVFRALGDATRYAIARMIAREALTSAELARRLGVSGPTLTHHLKRLRDARLVIEEHRGNSIVLRLDRGPIAALSASTLESLSDPRPFAIRRSRRS
jgi:DNA-binding transcriptional ArsR family regulator